MGQVGTRESRFLLESLLHCIKEMKVGRWEREWKENGRSYSLVHDENRGGAFFD